MANDNSVSRTVMNDGRNSPLKKRAKLEESELSSARLCASKRDEEVHRLWKLLIGLKVDYYSQFYCKCEADRTFQALEKELEPYLCADTYVKIWGQSRKIPRKQTAFGDKGVSYNFSGTAVAANEWIPEIKDVKERVESTLGLSFNFVLVNRYQDGEDHIGEHRDDETDLCKDAPIASVSFGQARDFVFKHRDSRGRNAKRKDIQPVKVCLQHGSLLVMHPPTNVYWYHSLPPRKSVFSPRINLTFRKMRDK